MERTGALGRSQRAVSVYGGFGPAADDEHSDSDSDGSLPDDPDSDDSFGC